LWLIDYSNFNYVIWPFGQIRKTLESARPKTKSPISYLPRFIFSFHSINLDMLPLPLPFFIFDWINMDVNLTCEKLTSEYLGEDILNF
jgi:hypothetical protein